MKHAINLYHPSLRPERELLTSQRLLLTLALVVLVLVGWRVALGLSEFRLAQSQTQVSAEQSSLRADVTTLGQRARERRPDRDLSRRVDALEADIAVRRALLQEFARRGQVQRQDFSPLLTQLAAIHQDGIWLTRIRVNQERVELHGKTLNAALIPRWMGKFEEAQSLAGFRFSIVELKRDSQEILNFALSSQPLAPPEIADEENVNNEAEGTDE
ncbi:MAG: hypothetical protein JJU10_09960 [Idiomarina sp.]|nr:hypothetical protein [Idiomarina sp.]